MISIAKPLPPNSFEPLSERKWYDAYQQCLQIEPLGTNAADRDAVNARILGHLLLRAPTAESRNYISQKILQCNGDIEKLWEISELFMSIVRNMPAFMGSSAVSESLRYEGEIFDNPPKQRPTNYGSARRSALHRDGGRCMVSRIYDTDYFDFAASAEEREEWFKAKSHPPIKIRPYNIIPILPNGAPDHVSSFLLNFFSISHREFKKVTYSLTNTLTLNCNIGPHISHFHVWFEAIDDDEDTYNICSWSPGFLDAWPSSVTFSTETDFPKPNPLYLKMHAAFCQVIHQSGAFERQVIEDYKKRKEKEAEGKKEEEELDDDGGGSGEEEPFTWQD